MLVTSNSYSHILYKNIKKEIYNNQYYNNITKIYSFYKVYIYI